MVNKPGWAPLKLNQNGKHSNYNSASIRGCSNYGPSFGKFDLQIVSNASSSSNSCSDLGYTYSPPSGHNYASNFAREFLAGSYRFTPQEIETFYFFKSQGGLLNVCPPPWKKRSNKSFKKKMAFLSSRNVRAFHITRASCIHHKPNEIAVK